jgi:TonB-dependent starch-binding outer membrane protein SusC
MRGKLCCYLKHFGRTLGRVLLFLAVAVSPHLLLSQNLTTVTGTVLSGEDNSAMPGVSIVVKNTSTGTVTDVDGRYSLSAPENAVLVFSFVGFTSEEVPVGGRSAINVTMASVASTLQEVVVTGYSTQRKQDITGSVSVVNMKDYEKNFSRSAQEALQGMAPGVNVIRSGVPGSGSKILIRGVTSFGDTEPLVIVDGIQQDLNNIPASDIESIQVLKDAGAASIYGVRGSNGVIVVTTKKGKKGPAVVTYDVSYGMQYPLPGNPLNLANPQEYMQIYNAAFPGNETFANGIPDYTYRGPGGAGVAFEGDPEVDPSLYVLEVPNKGRNYAIYEVNKSGTDWFHEMYKPAPSMEHKISASGGSDNARYLFSLGYLDQKGTMIETYYKRYSLRINTEYNVGKHIKIGENLNLIVRDLGAVSGSQAPYQLQSMLPVKDIMGNWAGSFGGIDLGQASNPVASQYRNKDDIRNSWAQIGNIYAEVDFLKGFKFRSSLGYNFGQSYTHDFSTTGYETAEGNTTLNGLTISSGYNRMMTFTNTLTYNKKFAKHNINVIAGSEAIEYQERSADATRRNFFNEDPNFQVLGNGEEGEINSSEISKHALASLFARADYSFDDRYLFSATIRRDGSSRFGSGSRYGVFPAFSVGWRIANEGFMQDVAWLTDLKLRASYGVLGSQNNVDPLNQFSLFNSVIANHYYDLAGNGNASIQGFGIQRFGNRFTGWEENIVSNIGFDATLLDGKLDVSAEYYQKAIEGLLFTEPLPAVLGNASAPKINIGDIRNTGIDFLVTYRGELGSDLRYSVGANVTTYNNEVVDIPDPGYFDSGVVRNQEGEPVSSFFGYKVLGLFNSAQEVADAPTQQGSAPGRFRFQDTNNDGIISADDRVALGDPNPDFTYGLNLRLEYKNFDLAAFFYGSQGNEIYSSIRNGTEFIGSYPGWNKSRVMLNAWTPENTNTTVPRIEAFNSPSTWGSNNSYYVEDGSFLKFRSLTLGYQIPSAVLDKIKISNARLFAQGLNLFTLTGYSGLDPEVGGGSAAFGVDGGSYPKSEAGIMFGLSVTF